MERDMKEVIIENRKALGMYGGMSISEVVVSSLELSNKMVSLETIINANKYHNTEYILADGLIVGYV